MKKPKKYWNYRVTTYVCTYKLDGTDLSERLFSITEVYYENDIPVSYGSKNVLKDYEDYHSLHKMYNKIKDAFNKPILDEDNWPNEYKIK